MAVASRSGWRDPRAASRTVLTSMSQTFFELEENQGIRLLRLGSEDGPNRLTLACIVSLTETIREVTDLKRGLILAGNDRFLSAGAELEEIAALSGPAAYEFARIGQALMTAIESVPVPTYAAISGYCMGGGLDLALACHRRIAAPNAILGHRGAALGLITGWGGTQRLPRVIGKGQALAMFVAAETITALSALQIGLVDAIADDPVAEAIRQLSR